LLNCNYWLALQLIDYFVYRLAEFYALDCEISKRMEDFLSCSIFLTMASLPHINSHNGAANAVMIYRRLQYYSGRPQEMNDMILSEILLALLLQGQQQFIKATIRRLPPRTFRQLPAAIVEELEARKCLIPQYPYIKTPHNVIRGSFTGEKVNEWAALCSRKGTSSIMVFCADSAKLVAETAAAKDENYLQDIDGPGTLGYSRVISAAGEDYILEHYKWYGGPDPPPITHHGINDAFAEKASVVRYFYRGKWIELQGAD
jgi:hypothetical protein